MNHFKPSTYASFGSGMGLADLAMTRQGHVEVAHAEIDYYANFLKEEYFRRYLRQPKEKRINYNKFIIIHIIMIYHI